jgi:hypothetical protein
VTSAPVQAQVAGIAEAGVAGQLHLAARGQAHGAEVDVGSSVREHQVARSLGQLAVVLQGTVATEAPLLLSTPIHSEATLSTAAASSALGAAFHSYAAAFGLPSAKKSFERPVPHVSLTIHSRREGAKPWAMCSHRNEVLGEVSVSQLVSRGIRARPGAFLLAAFTSI